jgi:hypothetical protein
MNILEYAQMYEYKFVHQTHLYVIVERQTDRQTDRERERERERETENTVLK